jgi:hypothetical protein
MPVWVSPALASLRDAAMREWFVTRNVRQNGRLVQPASGGRNKFDSNASGPLRGSDAI